MPTVSLKDLRGRKTQREVARETNITEATLRNAEQDPNSMSMSTAIALANFYRVPLDDLVDRSREEKE